MALHLTLASSLCIPYNSVYYVSHKQSFPSTSEEKHVFWHGFGEHVGDAITHKLLDSSSHKIIYRSVVHPADDIHHNNHLLSDLGESEGSNKPKPITFVKSHQDLDKSVSKPMAEYNPDDLIGRTFLLPPNQKGERHRASIKQKVIEITKNLMQTKILLCQSQLTFRCRSGEIPSDYLIY